MTDVIGTAPILGPLGANIVDSSGKITDAARTSLVNNVVKLLQKGNKDGKGLLLSSLLSVPMPPTGGPNLPAGTLANPLATEPIFWFEPDPYAALVIPTLLNKNSNWNKIYVDGLYAAIANGLNMRGSYVPPVFDPTIFGIDIKIELPEILVVLPQLPALIPPKIGTPEFLLKLKADYNLDSIPIPEAPKIPIIKIPEIPTLPTISLPEIPTITLPGLPNVFLDFIPKIPGLAFPPAIPTSFPDFFLKPFNLLLNFFFKLAFDFGILLISPKVLMATMLVILHNVAVMIAADVIGSTLGTGGLVKAVATFGGLLA